VKQTPSSFRNVLGPKVSGLITIAARVQAMPLCSLVLFSSISSIVAPLGQPNYAAANAMLNALGNNHNQKV